jgi:hypothetical protein
VALFNGGNSATTISLNWQELGWQNGEITGVAWADTHVNSIGGGVSSEVLPHQAVVLTVCSLSV